MKSQDYLLKCIELIEAKVNWGKSEEWIDYNFKTLSEQIFDCSSVTISIRTLKRIFKPANSTDSSYEPQIATKNALAQFLGYKDWHEFIIANSPNEKNDRMSSQTPEKVVEVPSAVNVKKKKPVFFPLLLLLCLLGVAMALFFFLRDNNKVQFVANTTLATAPRNIAFRYDLSEADYKNAIIDFDYGGLYKQLINNKGELLFNYKTPNFYKVKLITDGKVMSTINIDMVSNGWVSYIGNNDANARIIHDSSLFRKDGHLYFSPEELQKQNIDTTTEYWVDYRNIKNFHINGDNLIIELRLKNAKVSAFDCSDACIEYVGEEGRGRYRFVRPNCTEYADAEFGDTKITGSFHNLSPLGLDLSDWTNIRIEVRDKTGMVYINDVFKYKISYNKPIGNIQGFFCRFKGPGSLDFFKIYDLNKKLLYDDEF